MHICSEGFSAQVVPVPPWGGPLGQVVQGNVMDYLGHPDPAARGRCWEVWGRRQ